VACWILPAVLSCISLPAAAVWAKVLGRRQGYGTENLSPLLRTMPE
jgi:hypothetical protein